jgi:hypothetical protein
MKKHNAFSLLKHLEEKGHKDISKVSHFIIEKNFIEEKQEKDTALHLKILGGVGIFIAAFYFMLFVKMSDIFKSIHDMALIVLGGIFVLSALGLKRLWGEGNDVKHIFFMQCSLGFMVLGKSVFVYGLSKFLNFNWGISLALILITILTYPYYKISIDRFLSSFMSIFSIFVTIFVTTIAVTYPDTLKSDSSLLINGFFLMHCVGLAVFLKNDTINSDIRPLFYALIVSLYLASIVLLFFDELDKSKIIHNPFINTMLVCGFIILCGWVSGSIKNIKTHPLILVSVGAILLGLMDFSLILVSIGLMVLGRAKDDKILTVLGIFFMPVFLFIYSYSFYFYSIDISLLSLLEKSVILISSGILFLLGRFYLHRKRWDKEDA